MMRFRRNRDDTVRYGTVDGFQHTIHSSGALSIEVDDDGRPTAVWFRCLNLPFTVWRRDNRDPACINPDDMVLLHVEYRVV